MEHIRGIFAAAAITAAILSTPARADRQPVPTTQQVATAETGIDEVYKDKLSRPGQADRIALASEMLDQADASAADPESQYALLCKARDLAAGAGDLDLAAKCCDELTADFTVTAGAAQTVLYTEAANAMFTDDDYSTYVAAVLQAVDAALKCDDFDSARSLLKLAAAAAPKSRNERLEVMTRLRTQAATLQERFFKNLQPQFAALNANPNDPKASTAVGSYVCFWDQDWDRGLPILANGSDGQLADLARQDLQAPIEPEAQAALGDAWYVYSNRLDGPPAIHIEMRAYDWLQKAAPQLTGLRSSEAETRLANMDHVLAPYRDWGQIWMAIRGALRRHTAVQTNVVGGGFGRTSYLELPQAGAILVGFRFGLGRFVNETTLTEITAIYQTPEGNRIGQTHGESDGPFVGIRARGGYAVGAVEVHGGGGLDAVVVTFYKIVGNHLDPTQSYTSSLIGGTGGGAGRVIDGHGVPIIGISGKIDSRDHAAGLGVVFMSTPSDADDTIETLPGRRLRAIDLTPAP